MKKDTEAKDSVLIEKLEAIREEMATVSSNTNDLAMINSKLETVEDLLKKIVKLLEKKS